MYRPQYLNVTRDVDEFIFYDDSDSDFCVKKSVRTTFTGWKHDLERRRIGGFQRIKAKKRTRCI